MSIDKNFVIKNGLEVDNGTLFVNPQNSSVGVGTTNPNYNLEVSGIIGLSSAISIGGTTGITGQALFSTGDGAEWRALPNLRESVLEIASEGQTVFPASTIFEHNPLLLDVFLNGVKLREISEYTSVNSDTRVQILVPTFLGDVVELITYSTTSFASGSQGIQGSGGISGAQGADGLQGTDGAFAAQGIQGNQGIQGSPGTQGFEGIPGPLGIQGIQGNAGVQGDRGVQGSTGPQGSQGIQGLIGPIGIQGDLGFQGIQGSSGIQGDLGIQGNQGIQGSQGDQVIARTYTFTAAGGEYYIDGIVKDTLHLIRGQKYIFNGSSATTHPIRLSTDSGNSISYSTGYTIGSNNTHTFIVPYDAPDTLYYYCTNHSNMGASISIKDLTGNDLQGTQGISGSAVAQGIQGSTGQGAQGTQGTQGTQGSGIQGTQGIPGSFAGQGIQGVQGLQGILGSQGTAGNFAGQGIQGIQGLQGILGPQGTIGIQGVQGILGNQGIQGRLGTQGPFGIQGTLGFQGNQGVQGTQGLVGAIGSQGTAGEFAAQGIQGSQGTSGVQGAASNAEGYWEKNIYNSGISTTSDVGIGTTSAYGPNAVDHRNTALLAVGSIKTRNVNSINLNLSGIATVGSGLNVVGVTTISSGRIQIDGAQNIRIGNSAAGSGSNRNIAIGDQVLGSLASGNGRNIGIGEFALNDITSGAYNIGLGVRAGQKIDSGSYNVVIGGYDGDETSLDITESSNNIVISDGEGNIRQYIDSNGKVCINTTVPRTELTVSGIVSATSFYGQLNASQLTGSLPSIDGSSLIGVVATNSGIVVANNDTVLGVGATLIFADNLGIELNAGVATVSISDLNISNLNVSGISTLGVVAATELNVSGVSTLGAGVSITGGNIHFEESTGATNNRLQFDTDSYIYKSGSYLELDSTNIRVNAGSFTLRNNLTSLTYIGAYGSRVELFYSGSKKLETSNSGIDITGSITATDGVTATTFSGSGANLTNIPSSQLSGALPALDGSALTGVIASGTGIEFKNNDSVVGTAGTINFGSGLDVQYNSNAGITTVVASGGSLQSRTTVSGSTPSIADNATAYISINGFKSYALMHVGLSTEGWIRLYTDSTSRSNDSTRSLGDDPLSGSGVIAEVATSGISTQQNISPFVLGGNMNDPVDTTIYVAITNLSGSTQSITAYLKILQLEA